MVVDDYELIMGQYANTDCLFSYIDSGLVAINRASIVKGDTRASRY